jgi:hypothetical protein
MRKKWKKKKNKGNQRGRPAQRNLTDIGISTKAGV